MAPSGGVHDSKKPYESLQTFAPRSEVGRVVPVENFVPNGFALAQAGCKSMKLNDFCTILSKIIIFVEIAINLRLM
jgi:hypothetical protein